MIDMEQPIKKPTSKFASVTLCAIDFPMEVVASVKYETLIVNDDFDRRYGTTTNDISKPFLTSVMADRNERGET